MAQRRDDVTIREYTDMRVASLKEYATCEIAALRRLLTQRLDDMDRATVIRATEMWRRLEDLNHSQERADKTHGTYLPREIYEKSLEEWRLWRASVDTLLARAAERKAVYASLVVSGLTFIGIIATTILRVLGK